MCDQMRSIRPLAGAATHLMGSVFRRASIHCIECNARLTRSVEKEACRALNHTLREYHSRVWWIGYKAKDGWRYESSYSHDKADAQRKLRERETAVDRGAQTGRLSFRDAAKAAIQDYKINKRRSLDEFERRIRKHLTPFFGEHELALITTPLLRTFIDARQKAKASNAEINRELDAVSKMFKLAIQDGQVFHRPHIPKLKESAPRKSFVTEAEYLAMRTALPVHMRNIWAFQYLTGWRSTEVLALRWEHVGETEIRFTGQTKGDEAARPFPITAALRALLDDQERLLGSIDTAWVFCFLVGKKMAGRPITYNGWLHAFNDARDIADVRKDIIPHDCRRTAIDRMERLGVARSTAMKMVGHKTESVYRRYAITSARTLEDAGAKLDAVALPDTPHPLARRVERDARTPPQLSSHPRAAVTDRGSMTPVAAYRGV